MNQDQIVELGKIVTILFKGPSSKPLNISINSDRIRYDRGAICISPEAPLAQAILSHKEGEDIEFIAPEGKLKVRIIKVVN